MLGVWRDHDRLATRIPMLPASSSADDNHYYKYDNDRC